MNNTTSQIKHRSVWKKRMLVIISIFFAALGILLVVGYASQKQLSKTFTETFPPVGQLVDVEGTTMHLYCVGEGGPTVILDAGNGRTLLDWSLVQPELAKTTRVCSFDRPGYGWSEPATTPRTGKQIVEEERKLLQYAGIPGPYILVGHSGGGMYARIFAKYYSRDVAGLVLIDSAAVSADTFEPLQKATDQQWKQNSVMKTLATVGFFSLLGKVGGEKAIPDFIAKLPQGVRPAYLATISQPSYFDVMKQEGEHLSRETDDVWEELNSITSFGDLPVAVITADKTFPENNNPQSREINDYLRESQQILLNLSTRSTQVIAKRSHHDVHLDEPDVVIEQVSTLVQDIEKEQRGIIEQIQRQYPDFQQYPSDELPPTSVLFQKAAKGWDVAFIQEGSGVSIIKASCFSAEDSMNIQLTGEYVQDPLSSFMATTEQFSVRECAPVNLSK